MIIREAEKKDSVALSGLLEQLGYPASANECAKRIEQHLEEGYKLFVGEVDGRIIGFIALHWYRAIHYPKPIGRVVGFCMDEKIRGGGLGSALLEHAEKFLLARNCFKVELTSNLRRNESHAYYLKRGYRQTSMHLVKFFTN